MAGFTSTMMAIAATAAVATAGISAAGSIAQGKRMSDAEKYNAEVARQEATALRTATDFEIERRRESTKALVSRQRALFGKSGVRFSGSPVNAAINTIAESEMDIAVLDYNAKVGISRKASEAGFRRTQAKGFVTESYIKAGTTLLATGTQLAMQKWGK